MKRAARQFLAGLAFLSLIGACAPAQTPERSDVNATWERAAAPANSIAAESRKASDSFSTDRFWSRDEPAPLPAARAAFDSTATARRWIQPLSGRRSVLLRSARRRN